MEDINNRYKKVDNVFGKTIRYRQMVGLLASSSIRSFRKRPRSCSTNIESVDAINAPITTTTTTITPPTDITNIDATSVSKSNLCNDDDDEDDVVVKNSFIPSNTNSVEQSSTIAPATTSSQQHNTSDKVILNQYRHPTYRIEPIAIDVIQYLFHNNNYNCNHMNRDNNIKTQNNNHVRLSNLMEQQKKQQQQQHHQQQFNIDQHHPGYIPIDLWKDYVALKNNRIFNNLHEDDVVKKNLVLNMGEEDNERQSAVDDTKRPTLLQFAPVCFDCGGIIQPGVMNTTIQMVEQSRLDVDATTTTTSLSRTQRRRESRFKATLYRKQFYGTKQLCRMMQSNNTTNISKQQQQQHLPSSKSKIWQCIWQQQNKYYHKEPSIDLQRIYPFLNCCNNSFCYSYIITCGSCGSQIYLSGNNNDTYIPPSKVRSNINLKKRNHEATTTTNAMHHQQYSSKRNINNMKDTTPVKITQIENHKKQRDIYFETSSATIIDNDVDATTDNNPLILNGPERTSTENSSKISEVITKINNDIGNNSMNNNVHVQRAIIDTTTTTTTIPNKPVQQQQQTLMSQSHGSSPNYSLTLLNPSRTTKKKKSKQQKNDLMSFLSSLNDR
jgi:hypothetical protein